MNIVVIQPNWNAVSEVWLHRMHNYIERDVRAVAAYLPVPTVQKTSFEFFNLNGLNPSFSERLLIRLGLTQYNRQRAVEKGLLNLIKRKKADLVLVHYLTTAENFSEVIRKVDVPVLIHVHGYDILWDARDFNDSKKFVHHKNYKARCRELAKQKNVHLVANSNLSKNQLTSAGVDPGKIILKYYGVPDIQIKRNFKKENLTVLFLGRFVEFKGPDLVMEAYFKACEMGFKGDLIMAGDGPMKPFCELMARRSAYGGRVQFLGEVRGQQVAEVFARADIYTMHSCRSELTNEVEAFGVSLIEAMSYQLPVITGSVGGPVEIITNGVDGLLVAPGDTDAHADGLMKLFADRDFARQLGYNASRKVAEKFSARKEKETLLSTIHSLVTNVN